MKQARKPRSYASLKLRLTDLPTHLLTRVKSRATSVAKNVPCGEKMTNMMYAVRSHSITTVQILYKKSFLFIQ